MDNNNDKSNVDLWYACQIGSNVKWINTDCNICDEANEFKSESRCVCVFGSQNGIIHIL